MRVCRLREFIGVPIRFRERWGPWQTGTIVRIIDNRNAQGAPTHGAGVFTVVIDTPAGQRGTTPGNISHAEETGPEVQS